MSKKLRTGLLAYLLFPVAVFGREEKPTVDSVNGKGHHHHKVVDSKVQYGVASYYANKFEGRKTYTDEIFRQSKLTAASNTLPMGTWVKLTNLRNHRTVYVRINDKMHPKNKRLIDMSRVAAERLGFAGRGLTHVKMEVLGKKKPEEADKDLEWAAKEALKTNVAADGKTAGEDKASEDGRAAAGSEKAAAGSERAGAAEDGKSAGSESVGKGGAPVQ